jgi:hypothetical protein
VSRYFGAGVKHVQVIAKPVEGTITLRVVSMGDQGENQLRPVHATSWRQDETRIDTGMMAPLGS